MKFYGFIPVHTGQIVFLESAFKRRKVHPSAYGADPRIIKFG